MKKLFYIGALSALLLAACGDEEKGKVEPNETNEVSNKEDSEYPFPGSELIGNATITITTPAGDSSNGNTPTLFVGKDDMLNQVGIDLENFDGSVETYVYINEVFLEKVQAGELTQSSLSLTGDNLKPGEYTVTAVQFTDNDPTKTPFNVTEAKFKIEES